MPITPKQLGFEKQIREQVIDLDIALIRESLNNSQGQDSMSALDSKMAIVALYGLAQNQQHLINYLFKFLLTEPKQPWYKRIFQK
jgi:hypothetical protein